MALLPSTPTCSLIDSAESADLVVVEGSTYLSVERTLIDLVDELDREGDLDAVVRTALRHRLTTPSRLRVRAEELAADGVTNAAAVLDVLCGLGI